MADAEFYISRVNVEYENLKKIFEEGAPEQLELLDGIFREAARLKVELDDMAVLVTKCGGRIRYNPKNPKQQETLSVSRELEKTRAAYKEYIRFLSHELGVNTDYEENDGLSEFE